MLAPDAETTRPGRHVPAAFNRWNTAAYALAWLGIVALGWSPLVALEPVAWLQSPVESAARMTARNLELSEAIERKVGLERRILQSLYGTLDESLQSATEIQRQLAHELSTGRSSPEDPGALDRARARLSVLLAEAGQPSEAFEIAARVREPSEFAIALHAAYADEATPPPQHRGIDGFEQAGLLDWYLDRARIARAVRSGDLEGAGALEAQLLARGSRWMRRSVSVFGANLGLVALGAVLLATRLRGVRALLTGARVGPTWTLEDGIGVFIRGDCWNRLYFVGIAYLDQLPLIGSRLADSWPGELLQAWATLFASLPLLWLIQRHLLAPNRQSAWRTFGAGRNGAHFSRILRVGLVAISIDLTGTYAIGWSTWGLGVESPWTEGFDEMLVWGSPARALLTSIDYVLWAPVLEEFAFRGVLYFSLRHRLGPLSAALLTATFFAALHFYALPGLLMTMWSGLVWALAFERIHSLLPGIAAHAAYNGLYVLGLVLLYR